MMKQTTKRLLVSLAALILSVGAVCTSYAASDKRKVGKMDLVFDSNLGIGVEGSSLSVTAEGANTDRYYISDTDVVLLLSCEADGRSKFSLEFEGGC